MLLLLACTGPAADDVKSPVESDTDTDTDTDTDADTDTVAGPTDGDLAVPFTLDASGTGDDRVDSVELLDAAGTIELDGVGHAAVAYQDHDWTDAGYHLYDLVSVAEDGSNLAVTYLYCSGDDLPYAYTESFTHPMAWETTRGSCDGAVADGIARAELPALLARPEPIETGFTFDGELAEGRLTLEDTEREWIPFNTVDCAECPGGPWYELHSLLVGEGDACFAILYLFPDDPTFVQVEYTLCLPTLERPTGVISATWSGSPQGPPAPMRPRPPRRW
ncbi:MAG: hypothetical protein ACOZNI_18820 [Myxococcota bacterium]